MNITSFLLIATILSLIPGQLVRIPVADQSFVTISDLLVLVTDFVFLASSLFVKKSLKLPYKITFPVVIFTLAAFASTFLASTQFSLTQITVSLLFLVRFILYFFLFVVVANTVTKDKINDFVNVIMTTGAIFVLLGFLQLLIFPDLSFLTIYGWDPHQRRIASTLLDPNFSGWLFTFLFTTSTALYLYKRQTRYLAFSLITFLAIVLTFSRSTYLAWTTAVLIMGILKSPKLLLASLIIFALAFFSIGQVRSRIIGALEVDETAQARLQSWQNALTIFKGNLAFGVGFNTYRFAQDKYGLFSEDNPLGGHSGAGSDSSILLVAATTGITGLAVYIFLLASIFQALKNKIKTSYLHLAVFASYCALLVHSQFVNSLFFPQIMLFLWVSLGLVAVYDS